MSKNIPTELGTKPIGPLLLQYALPAIIAMTASSIYNNVDRIFIGQIMGPLAISGLATTFPFMNLSVAVGSMVGVGSSTVISLRLGQKKYGDAQHMLGNSMTLNIIFSILLTIVGLKYIDPVLYLFGATPATLPYAKDYMEIILWGNLVTHCYFGLNAVLRSAGHPTMSMVFTLLSVVVNIILDFLFIFVFGMGIRGAAIATIISQLVSLVLQLRFFINPSQLLHFRAKFFWLKPTLVRQMLAIGLSPFLMNSLASVVVLIVNRSLLKHGGELAIGAYGIINSVLYLFFMVVFGLNMGMQPIVGYNWGAHQNDRVWRTLRLTISLAVAVTTACLLTCELFPEEATRVFTSDPEIVRIASRGFRIVAASMPVVGAQMVLGNFFQNIGHASKSIFMSVTRQLLFLIPLLLVLPDKKGLDGVWLSMLISDVLSFVVAVFMFLWLLHHLNEKNRAHQ